MLGAYYKLKCDLAAAEIERLTKHIAEQRQLADSLPPVDPPKYDRDLCESREEQAKYINALLKYSAEDNVRYEKRNAAWKEIDKSMKRITQLTMTPLTAMWEGFAMELRSMK